MEAKALVNRDRFVTCCAGQTASIRNQSRSGRARVERANNKLRLMRGTLAFGLRDEISKVSMALTRHSGPKRHTKKEDSSGRTRLMSAIT